MVKNIGISNYSANHLVELLSYAEIAPFLHQLEIHPLYFPEEIIQICKRNSIKIQAYSSLGEGYLLGEKFNTKFPIIQAISQELSVQPAQVLLKWALQHAFYVIPKSSKKERVAQNISLDFVLSSMQMQQIDEIHKSESKKICWDSSSVY